LNARNVTVKIQTDQKMMLNIPKGTCPSSELSFDAAPDMSALLSEGLKRRCVVIKNVKRNIARMMVYSMNELSFVGIPDQTS
jgi:hypothetical protein